MTDDASPLIQALAAQKVAGVVDLTKSFAVIASILALLTVVVLLRQIPPQATLLDPDSDFEESNAFAPPQPDFSDLIALIQQGSIGTSTLSLQHGGGTIVHDFDDTREDTPQIRWVLWADGSLYVTRLTLERIRGTPKWNLTADDGAENPPLSARSALERATWAIENEILPYGEGVSYRTPVLKLQQFDTHWFWIAYFTPDNIMMESQPFPVVVLMDGDVLQPTSGPNASFLQDTDGGMGGGAP